MTGPEGAEGQQAEEEAGQGQPAQAQPPQPQPAEPQAGEEAASPGQATASKSASKRVFRGIREVLSLGQADLLASGGRPSRRAATAAQAAMAHTIAFERSKGDVSPPKPPGEPGLAERMLAAFQGAPAAAAAPQASPPPPPSRRGTKRQASVAASGASSAADGGGTPATSGANSLPASEGSDWEQSVSGRNKRPARQRAATGSRKSRAAAGPSAARMGQAAAASGAAGAAAAEAAASEPAVEQAQPQQPAGAATGPDGSGSSPEDVDAASADAGAGAACAAAAAAPSEGMAASGVPPLQPATSEPGVASPKRGPAEQAAAAAAPAEGLGEPGPTAAPEAAGPSAGALAAAQSEPPRSEATAGTAAATARSGPSPSEAMPSQLVVPPSIAHYPQEVLRLAALARTTLGLQRGQQANLRMVMKTGLLAGLNVHFQNKAGKLLSTGVLNAQGFIDCNCARCNGKSVSCSDFEEHAGSRDRRPADGIFLSAAKVSMRDVVALVNHPDLAGGVDVHMEVCYSCKEGGDLVCCDGCTAAFHLGCANLEAVPEGDWFCPVCASEGRTRRPLPPPVQTKPPRPPGRSKHQSAAKMGGAGGGSSDDGSEGVAVSRPKKSSGAGQQPTSPTGRVHMAAPSAGPRRPGVRRGRNSNKHKRLFEAGEGALTHGEKVSYITTQGETLLKGEVVISASGPSGILCYCCQNVVSCSQFEAHAGRGSRRAPYDNIFTSAGITLKAIAAALPELPEEGGPGDGEYDLAHIQDGCREVINELDTLAGGCCLCHEVDFQRGGFGPRTILFCDQCEREFHVGCLKAAGTADLQAVPEGDWFCSSQCTAINELLRGYVQKGQMEIAESSGHTWQLLRGKDGSLATTWSLKMAQDLLQESFDPIMDLSTNTDLLPLMIYARQYGEWDYKNCHVMLLRHKGKPVVAAIMRVFGPQLAELPLIATKLTARRQGHARVLLKAFDELLTQAGVHRLCLPAAHETVVTWRQGFSFVDMPEDEVKLAKQQLRILVFPGTEMLWKEVAGVPPPGGHHILVAPPEPVQPPEAAGGTVVPVEAAADGTGALAAHPAGMQLQLGGTGWQGPLGGMPPQQAAPAAAWQGAAGAYPPPPQQPGLAQAATGAAGGWGGPQAGMPLQHPGQAPGTGAWAGPPTEGAQAWATPPGAYQPGSGGGPAMMPPQPASSGQGQWVPDGSGGWTLLLQQQQQPGVQPFGGVPRPGLQQPGTQYAPGVLPQGQQQQQPGAAYQSAGPHASMVPGPFGAQQPGLAPQLPQVFAGTPIPVQPATASPQAQAAYLAAASLPFHGGSFRPASSQSYRPPPAGAQLAPSRSLPEPALDPYTASYDDMIAAAMVAADVDAGQQAQHGPQQPQPQGAPCFVGAPAAQPQQPAQPLGPPEAAQLQHQQPWGAGPGLPAPQGGIQPPQQQQQQWAQQISAQPAQAGMGTADPQQLGAGSAPAGPGQLPGQQQPLQGPSGDAPALEALLPVAAGHDAQAPGGEQPGSPLLAAAVRSMQAVGGDKQPGSPLLAAAVQAAVGQAALPAADGDSPSGPQANGGALEAPEAANGVLHMAAAADEETPAAAPPAGADGQTTTEEQHVAKKARLA